MTKRLNLSQMAERLGLSEKTLAKYVRLYNIPHIKLDRQMRFDPERVEAYLEARSIYVSGVLPARNIPARKTRRNNTPASNRFAEILGLN